MDTSKSKLQIKSGKPSKVTLGASASNNKKSPLLAAKKNYKKDNSASEMGMPSFGETGMTGES